MFYNRLGNALTALETGEIEVLAHGVNCSNGFGSGIAGQIAKKHPSVKTAFHNRHFKLGDTQTVQVGDNKFIVNCATQQYYGGDPSSQPNGMYCSYEAIESSLNKVRLLFKDNKIGIPYIGAGLAGGEWKYIAALISRVFEGETDVYAYKHNVTASEVRTIRQVLDYFEPTGFYSYREPIGSNDKQWDLVKRSLSELPHVWFGTQFDKEYMSVCKVKFFRDATIAELISLLNRNSQLRLTTTKEVL